MVEPSTEDTSDSEAKNGWAFGYAIQTVATHPDPPLGNGEIIDEWVDLAIYDDYAIQVGVSGIGLVSRDDGRVLGKQNPSRGYSVESLSDDFFIGKKSHFYVDFFHSWHTITSRFRRIHGRDAL